MNKENYNKNYLVEQQLLQESIFANTLIYFIKTVSKDLENNFINWKKQLKSRDPKKIEPIIKQIQVSYDQLETKTDRFKQLLNDLNNAKTEQEKISINKALQSEFPPLPATSSLDKQNIRGFADVLKQKVTADPSPSEILNNTLDQILNKYGKPKPEEKINILEIEKFIEDFKINENRKEKNKMLISESRLKQIINEELQAVIEEQEIDEATLKSLYATAKNIGKSFTGDAAKSASDLKQAALVRADAVKTKIGSGIKKGTDYFDTTWNNARRAGTATEALEVVSSLIDHMTTIAKSINNIKASMSKYKINPSLFDAYTKKMVEATDTLVPIYQQLNQIEQNPKNVSAQDAEFAAQQQGGLQDIVNPQGLGTVSEKRLKK